MRDKTLLPARECHTRIVLYQVDASEYKDAFKRFLYTALQEETGISLPWGNLTGIRPTKIAMTMLENGGSEQDVAAFLREKHFVSEEK